MYSLRTWVGPQEMERIKATAKHVVWPSCAWLLLSFFPFPLGHPMYFGRFLLLWRHAEPRAEGKQLSPSSFQQLRSPLGNVGNGNNYLETDLRRFAFLFSFLQPFFGPVSIELSGSYTLLGSTSTLNFARNKIILDGIYRQVKKVNARLCEFGPEAARTPDHPT